MKESPSLKTSYLRYFRPLTWDAGEELHTPQAQGLCNWHN